MIAKERIVDAFNGFEEDEFEIKWLHIGKFLRSMTINTSCCREEARKIKKKGLQVLPTNFVLNHVEERTLRNKIHKFANS